MFAPVTRALRGSARRTLPHLLALGTFACGAILVFSGATPSALSRAEILHAWVPLPVIESAHFLLSLIALGLLVIARGVQLRLDAAWWLACVGLACAAVLSVLKGLDWEEGLICCAMLAALLPCRSAFHRRASLMSQPFTPRWIAAIASVLLCAAWLGLFCFKHVEYSHQLWWRFAVDADAPRSLRSAVGVAVALLLFAGARLMRPTMPIPPPPSSESVERIRALVAAEPDTLANLALLGDKTFLLNDARDTVIMYAIRHRSWIALGDPIGPDKHAAAHRFCSEALHQGGYPAFYQIDRDHLSLYLDLGLHALKLGEEAHVDLADTTFAGKEYKGLRRTIGHAEKEGCTFLVVPRDEIDAHLGDLGRISADWLAEKGMREKGFSLGYFDEGYLRRFPLALVRCNGATVAFANVWTGAGIELSIDLMRQAPGTPRGVMDFLLVNLMRWGHDRGFQRFNLGMAPLSGFEQRLQLQMWQRIGSLVYRHGERFYNFKGLREFKDKYRPTWRSRYLACPGGLAIPRVLSDLAALIARGAAQPNGTLVKDPERALGDAESVAPQPSPG